MKLTEELKITHHEYGPASHHNREYSISDKSIDEFVAKLKKKGIDINVDDSEKKISYYSKRKNEHRKATIPLETILPEDNGSVVAYFLQGTGVGDAEHIKYKLNLKDYSSTGSSGRRIGGSVAGEYGIICKLTVEGDEIDTSIVDKVTKALHETYIPPIVQSKEAQEALADFQRQIDESLKKQGKK